MTLPRKMPLHSSGNLDWLPGLASALIAVLLTGCPGSQSSTTTESAPGANVPIPKTNDAALVLRLATVDDAALGDAIQREWFAHTQLEIEVQTLEAEDVLAGRRLDADVVIYPSHLLGEMVARRVIVPLPESDAESPTTQDAPNRYPWEDVFPWIRRRELKWGAARYGISLGSPELILLYRRDLFAEWQLAPPRTWHEYQACVATIQARLDSTGASEDRPTWATLEPLGTGWAARTFLARAASYAVHPNQYSAIFEFSTLKPLIAEPPFLRALEEMAVANSPLDGERGMFGPDEVAEQFLAGQAALAITWPSAARRATSQLAPEQLGIVALPGSQEVYSTTRAAWESNNAVRRVPLIGSSGRIGSVCRHTRSVSGASNLLVWISQGDALTRVATASPHTTIPRHSEVSRAAAWMETPLQPLADQYGQVLTASQLSTNVMQMLRIPGTLDYLAALDTAVRRALDGNMSPSESLQQLAEQEWPQVTEANGAREQQSHYLDSLGLEL